ncbi:NAC domain-containing protein 78 [Phtheirospermum japonicum]|uniref:NAC domain-containing protein 78 n=1 Tax=Phtheirospermum japonicum TaxID=374723 RepID=A0A830D287_9LAMI|nr:NAC domain-containing protein 78 [Phtheirospermum japonicum]
MGARFHPSDEEKITYLLYKVSGLPLPCDNFIDMDDLYGEKEPWEIFGDSDEGELYFFTVLKKIGKKGNRGDYKRFSRNVGTGTWSNKGRKVPIYRKGIRDIIGYKRCFRYERKIEGMGDNGTWLLKEYTLPDKVVRRLEEEYKDYVLCVLKRKSLGKGASGRGGENDQDYVESGLDYMLPSAINIYTCSNLAEKTVSDDDSVRGCCQESDQPIDNHA